MAAGAGKYDDLCTLVREQSGGRLVVVIVGPGGEHGPGFSVQGTPELVCELPLILRDLAAQIETDTRGHLKGPRYPGFFEYVNLMLIGFNIHSLIDVLSRGRWGFAIGIWLVSLLLFVMSRVRLRQLAELSYGNGQLAALRDVAVVKGERSQWK